MKKTILAQLLMFFLFLLSPLLGEEISLSSISESTQQVNQGAKADSSSQSQTNCCVRSTIPPDQSLAREQKPQEKKHVCIAILARNKEHLLPTYLKCLKSLEYDKKDITLYINTNNNKDKTEELLAAWIKANESLYRKIIFETHHVEDLHYGTPHGWTMDRLHTLALIRNRSLKAASEEKCDYYFVVDCDNFLIPSTLADLVAKDLPIVAPMLRSIPIPGDVTSNYFAAVREDGYYKDSEEFYAIFNRDKIGTFKVPLVHCTYLIKGECLDKLSYIDETEDYEFIIFARLARTNQINQYICNEKLYGYNLRFPQHSSISLENEIRDFSYLIPRIQKLLQK